jgi:galactose oxidase
VSSKLVNMIRFYTTLCFALWQSIVWISTAHAQATALGPAAVNRTGWSVTADSANAGNNASFVLDGNRSTFWHSEYSPVLTPLPHNITMDMASRYIVNGFTYLPRQDGVQNGNIGQHSIQVSLDGLTWTTAASGTWMSDATLKTTYFAVVPARYVRLLAQSEAQGKGYQWSSAAEINVLTNPHSTLSRQRWVVSADSQQGTVNNYNATEAIDGSGTTYWHTQYMPSAPPLPHYFTIDQGSAVAVGGLTYLPRPPSTSSNGNIGAYQVQQSPDGSTWTTIVSGTWPDNNNLKTAEFAKVTARYIRLVALSEAGNRGPWSSASEINLLDGSTTLADFTVTVDSQETVSANNSAQLATDGDTTTFWHTAYSGTAPAPLPHTFMIDMGTTYPVHALSYAPRQDGSSNGNIGNHSIDISINGQTWTDVVQGEFEDDATVKLVNFQEIPARYVRLTAFSEAGNRGPWSSAAEISVQFDTTYTTAAPNTMGQWGHMIEFPLVPVAVALIYSTGSVLAWSAEFADSFSGGSGSTLTATYNPTTGWVSERAVTNTNHEMF